MQNEIGDASILGFIPTKYPAGVVLYERFDDERLGIVRGTALVEDINTSDRLTNRVERGYDLERAIQDLTVRRAGIEMIKSRS